MKNHRPLIAFDFDGVISNSIHDSFVTALNSYITFKPDHALPLSKPIVPAKRIFDFEKEYSDLFAAFKSLLPMGNRAEDYYVILRIIEENRTASIQDQETFDDYKKRLAESLRNEYHEFFYQFRINLQKKDPEAWAELLPAFPGIKEAVPILSKDFMLAIATAKDRRSVDLQLARYGLTDFFDPNNILDKDYSESKREHLTRFHELHGTPYEHMHFIDDKVLHLVSVADLGIHCYLSMWGFNSEREHTIANENGFIMLELDQLINFKQFI
ncbi:HAD hydrolase-like protein [candidate division KSB1 bacterium]|nr:HAD hydrolase-like protein [candidate division KSB1 bacterium]